MNRPSASPSLLDQLVDHVRQQVSSLQRQYVAAPGMRPPSGVAATMAGLRRASPVAVGDDPAIWGVTLGDTPATLLGHGDEPSRAERVIHAALCLYAVHQHSRGDEMHRPGVRFGQAVGQLARARSAANEPFDNATVKRFHVVGTSLSPARRLDGMRALIRLMRGQTSPSIGLDYGLLARDLYRLDLGHAAGRVRLAWGRDLHRTLRPPKETSSGAEPATSHPHTEPGVS